MGATSPVSVSGQRKQKAPRLVGRGALEMSCSGFAYLRDSAIAAWAAARRATGTRYGEQLT